MTFIRQALSVAILATRGTFRNPLILVSIALLPATVFLLFFMIGGMGLSQHVLLGSMVAFTFNAGIVSLPQVFVQYKGRKLQDMFVASPLHPVTYMTGLGLSRLLYSAPNLALVLGASLWTGVLPWRALPGVLVVLLISWLIGSLIGFTVATYITAARNIGVVSNMLGTLLAAIPPVLYPLDLVPGEAFKGIAMAVPAAAAAQLVRIQAGATESPWFQQPLLWSILALYLGLGLLLVVRGSRWREV